MYIVFAWPGLSAPASGSIAINRIAFGFIIIFIFIFFPTEFDIQHASVHHTRTSSRPRWIYWMRSVGFSQFVCPLQKYSRSPKYVGVVFWSHSYYNVFSAKTFGIFFTISHLVVLSQMCGTCYAFSFVDFQNTFNVRSEYFDSEQLSCVVCAGMPACLHPIVPLNLCFHAEPGFHFIHVTHASSQFQFRLRCSCWLSYCCKRETNRPRNSDS